MAFLAPESLTGPTLATLVSSALSIETPDRLRADLMDTGSGVLEEALVSTAGSAASRSNLTDWLRLLDDVGDGVDELSLFFDGGEEPFTDLVKRRSLLSILFQTRRKSVRIANTSLQCVREIAQSNGVEHYFNSLLCKYLNRQTEKAENGSVVSGQRVRCLLVV